MIKADALRYLNPLGALTNAPTLPFSYDPMRFALCPQRSHRFKD
jgi:hypothetical protein